MKPVQWAAEGDPVENLKDWLSELECKLLEVEEGQIPGDSDRREEYDFAFIPTEGDYPVWSYLIKGPDECYLWMEGNWYSVSNPSDPPVAVP